MNLIPDIKGAESAWECFTVSKEFSGKNSVPKGYNSFKKIVWMKVDLFCSIFFFTELPLWELAMSQFRLSLLIIPPPYILQLFFLSLC